MTFTSVKTNNIYSVIRKYDREKECDVWVIDGEIGRATYSSKLTESEARTLYEYEGVNVVIKKEPIKYDYIKTIDFIYNVDGQISFTIGVPCTEKGNYSANVLDKLKEEEFKKLGVWDFCLEKVDEIEGRILTKEEYERCL